MNATIRRASNYKGEASRRGSKNTFPSCAYKGTVRRIMLLTTHSRLAASQASAAYIPPGRTHVQRTDVATAARVKRDSAAVASQLEPRLGLRQPSLLQKKEIPEDPEELGAEDRQPANTPHKQPRPGDILMTPQSTGPGHATSSAQGAAISRKVAILVDLLEAGSDEQLDSKLAQICGEVDEEMIGLLEARLHAARTYQQQGMPAVQHLEQLHHKLKRAHQRRGASPAMRLLDDVLELLGDGSDLATSGEGLKSGPARGPGGKDTHLVQAYEERRLEARSLMRDAFARQEAGERVGGSSKQAGASSPARSGARAGLDTKLPAQAPGSGAASATQHEGDESAWMGKGKGGGRPVDAVLVDDFLRETAQVLHIAEQRYRDLKHMTSGWHRDGFQPKVDDQLQQAWTALEECRVTMAQLEDVLTTARSLRAFTPSTSG